MMPEIRPEPGNENTQSDEIGGVTYWVKRYQAARNDDMRITKFSNQQTELINLLERKLEQAEAQASAMRLALEALEAALAERENYMPKSGQSVVFFPLQSTWETLEGRLAHARIAGRKALAMDLAKGPDRTVRSIKCGNCGALRMVDDQMIAEQCPSCGDDEIDLSIDPEIP